MQRKTIIPTKRDPENILNWIISSSFIERDSDNFVMLPCNVTAVILETQEIVELWRWLYESVFTDLRYKTDIVVNGYKVWIPEGDDIGLAIEKIGEHQKVLDHTSVSSQRQALLQSITTTIADYRRGEIHTIDLNHVDRWVTQFSSFGFDNEAQLIILGEMERILKSYYISRRFAQSFLTEVLTSQNMFGANPAATIRNTQFLQIQRKGNSQSDLLNLCEPILESNYGLSSRDCGGSPNAYIYLDDCLYSGNTVWRDVNAWMSNAGRGTTLHLIFFALYTEGLKYSRKQIELEAQNYDVIVKFWRLHEFHNSRWKRSQFDCFWALQSSGDGLIDRYVQEISERRQNSSRDLPDLFRPTNMPTQDRVFSSPAARNLIEYAFLKVGAYIVSLPRSPKASMKTLGYDYFDSLGFGAFFVTYRNIANNCPLALWWGDPNKAYPLNAWYPLFPRTVNITPTPEREEF